MQRCDSIKLKGTQKNKVFLSPNFSLLNGDKQICANNIPTFFLFYEPDKEDKTRQKVKIWMKFENINLQEIEQTNKNLKEISIWFNDSDFEKIKNFIKETEKIISNGMDYVMV